MKRRFLILLLLCPALHAQLWTNILAPARAVAWDQTSPGVVGGIPSANWAQCVNTNCQTVTTAGSSATQAQIQAAMASAPSNTYVLLANGTYTFSTGFTMVPNVVLRGTSASGTILNFTGGNSCGGQPALICFKDTNGYYYGSSAVQVGGNNSATFCGTGSSGPCTNTYTQGATTIQLTGTGSSGIVNGQYITLDQNNDNPSTASTYGPGLLICDNFNSVDGCSLEGGAPGRCSTGAGGGITCPAGGSAVHRNFQQIVKVVSGCASACTGGTSGSPVNVTITPGLYGLKWATGFAPGAWWSSNNMQNAGLENLTIDATNVSGCPSFCATVYNIYLLNAYNNWVSNVRTIKAPRAHVTFWNSAHNTVFASYFYGTQNSTTLSYGIEKFGATDNLAINNIFQQVTSPVESGPGIGNVFAYNFGINDTFSQTDWLQQWSTSHDAGSLYDLFEGNIGTGYWQDPFHGTGGGNTFFRNYGTGWEPLKTASTAAVQLYAYNRYANFVGNVFGCNNNTSAYPGNCGLPYPTSYSTTTGVGVSKTIFDLNAGNGEPSPCNGSGTCVLADTYVTTSLLRWGNYDVKNAAVRFVSGEVPSGLSDGYANSVPASQTLPASFWTAAKPAWWGNALPWPNIGPDVTNGTIPGVAAHAALNPAANCYFNTLGGTQDGSGSILSYDYNSQCKPSAAATSTITITGTVTITGKVTIQ